MPTEEPTITIMQDPNTETQVASGVLAPSPLAALLGARVTAVVEAKLASGELDAMIEEHVQRSLKRVLENLLQSYGPLGRALQTELESTLQVQLGDGGLGAYNARVMDIVKRHVNAEIDGKWAQDLESALTEMLAGAPETISLSAILTRLREAHEDDARENDWESAGILVERSDSNYYSNYCWVRLCASGPPNRLNYSKSYRMLISREDGGISHVHTPEGELKAPMAGKLYGFDRLLFQLLHGKTKVEFDLEPGEHEEEYEHASY